MKNLFKNLMLVAVAAMAFTACTETNDEVNAVSKKTVIKGVATIDNNGDDTRSAFGDRVEDENGNFYYESNWEGGESIHLYFSAGFSDDAEVDAAGNFEIEYIGDLDPGTTVTICSPYYAWDSVGTFVIPSEQTPLKNSVDPLVHILKSEPTEIVDNTISATMKHVAAYGKMTINAPEEFNISKVKVSFNGGQAYTLDAKNVENNVFWFTTTPMDVVNEFTVTAYDAQDKAITKTVNVAEAGKTLAFNTGRVSAFSVSGLKEVEVKDSAKATLVTDTTVSGFNPYDVTFSFKNGDKVVVRFATLGNQYLHLGDWQGDNWQEPHFISLATYNDVNASISACNVAYENDAYKVTFTVNTTNYTFTGAIQGLNAPEACDCLKPDGGDTGEGGENDINRFQIVPYGSNEIEVHFYLDEGTNNKIVLDFNITENDAKLKTKNYSWDNNGFWTKYSYINGAPAGVFIKTASVDVTNNGDGTYKFVGVVESTAGKKYNINISGTPVIG